MKPKTKKPIKTNKKTQKGGGFFTKKDPKANILMIKQNSNGTFKLVKMTPEQILKK